MWNTLYLFLQLRLVSRLVKYFLTKLQPLFCLEKKSLKVYRSVTQTGLPGLYLHPIGNKLPSCFHRSEQYESLSHRLLLAVNRDFFLYQT